MAEPVYLDNAATTPVDPRVFEAMRAYWLDDWGNPSSVYAVGRRARRALDNARDRCAQVLNCRANEIIFTGCGSESDNLSIKGSAMALAEQRGWKHVITSRVEHHAVLHSCECWKSTRASRSPTLTSTARAWSTRRKSPPR